MKRSVLIYAVAAVGLASGLAACQQRQEDTPAAATGEAADTNVTVNPPASINPPDVNINPPDVTPDVNINPPDVNVNPPDVDVREGPTEKSTTTVTIPGAGSTTTTVEKR